jgi:hypothetical protein
MPRGSAAWAGETHIENPLVFAALQQRREALQNPEDQAKRGAKSASGPRPDRVRSPARRETLVAK